MEMSFITHDFVVFCRIVDDFFSIINMRHFEPKHSREKRRWKSRFFRSATVQKAGYLLALRLDVGMIPCALHVNMHDIFT